MTQSNTIPHTNSVVECRIDDKGRIPLDGAFSRIGEEYDRMSVKCGHESVVKRTYKFLKLEPTTDNIGVSVANGGGQQRLTIPPAYIRYADLDGDIIIVPARSDRLEVWSRNRWDNYCETYQRYMGQSPNRKRK